MAAFVSRSTVVTDGAADVRRAGGRFHTQAGWLDSWHSFSFASHYDAANTHHGLLLVSNDDTVAPGEGFGRHAHRDMEIVTWVLSGELAHEDSTGTRDTIRPGLAQRMSAGSGIEHSEMNASATEPVHFVQMWVPPDEPGIRPGYEQADVSDALASGGLVAVASGREPTAAVRLHQPAATLWAARLRGGGEGGPVEVPDAPFVHVFVAAGAVELEGTGPLAAGDAVRLTGAGARRLAVAAGDPGGAEVLVWETHADLAGA